MEKIMILSIYFLLNFPLESTSNVHIIVKFPENKSIEILSLYHPKKTEPSGNKNFIIEKSRNPEVSLDIEILKPTYFGLHKDKGGPFDFINLLIYPKDTLIISFDSNNQMVFTGSRKNEWEFEAILTRYKLNFSELYKKSFSEAPFTNSVVIQSKYEINLLDSLIKNNQNLSANTIKMLRNEQLFQHLYSSLIDHKGVKNSKDNYFNNYMKSLYKYVVECEDIDGYTLYAPSLFLGTDFFDPNRDKEYIFENLINTTKTLLPPKQRDLLVLNIIREQINTNYNKTKEGISRLNGLINEFKDYSHNQEYVKVLENLIQKDKLKVDFKNLYNSDEKLTFSDGNEVKWKEFASKNENQNVLIDVWATWCSPCIKGINLIVKDTLYINNRNLKVVFISVDKLSKDWINGIMRLNMESFENYKIEPDSKIFEYLSNDKSVPQYILITKDGNVKSLGRFSPDEIKSKNMILDIINDR